MVKNKILIRLVSYIILLCLIDLVHAQNSIGTVPNHEIEAFSRFQKGEYRAVIHLVDEVDNPSVSEKYLHNMATLRVEANDPNGLEQLVNNYPKHPLNNQAKYTLGSYYFKQDNLIKSNEYLKSVVASSLKDDERKEFYFIQGYLDMDRANYRSSYSYFNRSQNLNEKLDPNIAYYQGFTAYHLDLKDEALEHFQEIDDDGEMRGSANYFSAKILLEKKEYDQVSELAQSQLTDEVSLTNSAFYQLIGESFALRNDAEKASNYFERAIQLHPSKPSAALYYQAGVANFRLGFKSRAIEYFKESGTRSGDYAKLSAFQLARLYLESNEFDKALTAYIEAASSDDPEMNAESLFNAGKLLINKKDFAEGINYLSDYKNSYPNGKWSEQAENLLAEAYLRTSNYDQAIAHLDAVGVKTQSQKAIYQKVTYQKGSLLYKDENYDESFKWFTASLRYPIDDQLMNDANYYIGEIYFNRGEFLKAIQNYQKESPARLETSYNIGYAYYNLYRYQEALPFFQRFISRSSDFQWRRDAEIRVADCYYALKNYSESSRRYQVLTNANPDAYLYYQLGLSNKGLGNQVEAIRAFENALQLSTNLDDDATFQIALANYEKADFEKAEFYFSSVISKYPQSQLIPESYLNRAVCRTNLNRLNGAKADYSYILDNHITSSIAFNAVLGLQELERKGVDVGKIEALIAVYKKANPDDNSLELVEFEFAKNLYFDLSYEAAARSFEKFISSYDKSSMLPEANYYLADSYYRLSRYQEALGKFQGIKDQKSIFTGRILSRLGEIGLKLEEYLVAEEAYTELINLDLTPKDTYNGRAGIMNLYFSKGDFNKSIQAADEILASDWKPINADRKATLIKAKSNELISKINVAKTLYESIADGEDAISAEASFKIASILHGVGDYDESLENLFEFNSRFGSYLEWIDKSYLLIADNYIALNDQFQAKATLRSIIEHSKDEETVRIANEKLIGIEYQVEEDTLTKNGG